MIQTMDKKDLQGEVDKMLEFAKLSYEKAKQFNPTLVILARHNITKKEQGLVMPLFNDELVNNRHKFLEHIGHELADKKEYTPQAILWASEAWTSRVAKGQDPNGIKPSQDPNRKEIFCITTMQADGKTGMQVYNIKRNKKEVNLIVNKEMSKGLSVESNLLNNFWQGYNKALPIS